MRLSSIRRLLAIVAMQVQFAMAPNPADPAVTRQVSAVIAAAPVGPPAQGACAAAYANTCPSKSNCWCLHFSGIQYGSLAGRGSSDVQMTVDGGYETSSPEGCFPFFATLSLRSPQRNLVLNATGAVCTASLKTGKEPIAGGYGIDSPASGPTGTGVFLGTIDNNSNIRLRLTGEKVISPGQ